MFGITQNKGFHITFSNGNTISVQFGAGNYCENQESAEIAIWNENDDWAYLGYGDTVKGWVSPNEVVKYINLAAEKTIEEINETLDKEE